MSKTTTAKHTPGPWHRKDHVIYAGDKNRPMQNWVCQLKDRHVDALGCDLSMDADARLIAAAPELLEALKRLVVAVASIPGGTIARMNSTLRFEIGRTYTAAEEAIKKADDLCPCHRCVDDRAAIAKAEGK